MNANALGELQNRRRFFYPRYSRVGSDRWSAVDLTKSDKLDELIEQILSVPDVDVSIDAVGLEAVITLDRAPEGYQQFDKGVAKKFVIGSSPWDKTSTGGPAQYKQTALGTPQEPRVDQ